MMERLLFALTFMSALGAGLIAGLFFAFSAFVMTALGRLPPTGGIAAMQSINVAVLNPAFLLVFLGTAAAGIVPTIASWSEPAGTYLLAGSLLYLLGSLSVTIVFNVPLNDRLASVDPDSADGAGLWLGPLSRRGHVMIVALICVALLGLSGCESSRDRNRIDESVCTTYGLKPGTADFASCVQREELRRSYWYWSPQPGSFMTPLPTFPGVDRR